MHTIKHSSSKTKHIKITFMVQTNMVYCCISVTANVNYLKFHTLWGCKKCRTRLPRCRRIYNESTQQYPAMGKHPFTRTCTSLHAIELESATAKILIYNKIFGYSTLHVLQMYSQLESERSHPLT